MVGVPLQIMFAIATATLLTKPRKGVKVYRTLYFLPAIAPIVAGSLAFLFLFNPAYRTDQPVPVGDRDRQPADVVLLRRFLEVGAGDPRPVGRR